MTQQPYDEAVEAIRQELRELPRYSFLKDPNGNVVRLKDAYGRHVELSDVQALFDPVKVDALLAKMQAHKAEKEGTSL